MGLERLGLIRGLVRTFFYFIFGGGGGEGGGGMGEG